MGLKQNVMKNYFKLMIAFLAGGAMLLSCQKENDIQKSDNDAQEVTIRLGAPVVKGLFDQEGIKWSAGDKIRFSNEGLGDVLDIELAAGDISSDGFTATITASFPNVTTAVFRHNYSPRNAAEWDFGYMGNYCGDGSAFTEWNKLVVKQSAAGSINKNFLFLHSGLNKLSFDPADPPATVPMEILGTIIRVLPYTTAYNDEEVQSVTISTSSAYGLGGCMSVNYAAGTFRDPQDVNWGPDRFNTYQVDLTTAFSLSGVVSKETSRAIYFSIPPANAGHSIEGYTIVVATDKATYTFDGSAKSLVAGNNKVKNFYLDLGKADTRVSNSEMYGIYWFDGNIGNREIPAAETTIGNLGYWVAYYQNTILGDDAVRAGEPGDNPAFYNGLTISAVDAETGTEPTWLTYGYINSSSSHWTIHADANTSISNRTATITIAPAASVPHYSLRGGEANKVITITQLGNVTITPVLSGLSSTSISAAGGSVTATLDLKLNGVAATEEQFNTYVSQVTLTSTTGTVSRTGHTVTLTVGENPATVSRDITITAAADSESSLVVSQEASASAKVYSFTYSLGSAWNASSCNPRELYFNPSAESGRSDWVIIVTDLSESGTPYTPGAAFDPDAVEPLLKQVLGLDDAAYTAMSSWLTLDIEVVGAQWIVVVRGFTQNTTGAARSIAGSFYNSDGTAYDGSYIIQQNP